MGGSWKGLNHGKDFRRYLIEYVWESGAAEKGEHREGEFREGEAPAEPQWAPHFAKPACQGSAPRREVRPPAHPIIGEIFKLVVIGIMHRGSLRVFNRYYN